MTTTTDWTAQPPSDVWEFALRACETALETIPDSLARLEASAQLGLALHYARSCAPADGDDVADRPALRSVTTP